MNSGSKLGIALLGLGLCGFSMIACNHDRDEESAVAIAPATPKFEGTIRPELAGSWASPDGRSKMTLDKSGTAAVSNNVATRDGMKSSAQSGQWLAGEGTLLIRLSGKEGDQVLLYYAKRPTSDTMELRGRPESKIFTTYRRAR